MGYSDDTIERDAIKSELTQIARGEYLLVL